MFRILNLILDLGLIATTFLYVFRVVQDIRKLSNQGTVYLTTKRQMNGTIQLTILTILMTSSYSIMYISDNKDIIQKIIIVAFGITVVGYWTYRSFSKPRLCEHVIITPEYVYSSKDFRGYELGSKMEEKGSTKLWVKVAEKTLLGKNRVKYVYFILKNEQIPEVEEILNTWSK